MKCSYAFYKSINFRPVSRWTYWFRGGLYPLDRKEVDYRDQTRVFLRRTYRFADKIARRNGYRYFDDFLLKYGLARFVEMRNGDVFIWVYPEWKKILKKRIEGGELDA